MTLPPRLRELGNYAPRKLRFTGPTVIVEGLFWQAMARDLPGWRPLPNDEFERKLRR